MPLVQVVGLGLLKLLLSDESLDAFGTSSDLEPLVLSQVDVRLKDMLRDDEPFFVLRFVVGLSFVLFFSGSLSFSQDSSHSPTTRAK